MKFHPRRLLPAFVAVSAFVFSPLAHVASGAVFSDTFNYHTWDTGDGLLDPMADVWTSVNGLVPTIVKSSTTYTSFETPYLNMRAGVITANLGQSLTGDFQLTVNALHYVDGRSFWVGLFNDAGTQGYGLRWEGYALGGGSLRMVSFDQATLASNLLFSATPGSPAFYLGGPVGRPGQPANTTEGGAAAAEFITVGLSWVAETKSLTLSIGGVDQGSVMLGEDAFDSFSKIYVGATADVAIGDITVSTSTIPEPAHAGVIVAGASLLAFAQRGLRRR